MKGTILIILIAGGIAFFLFKSSAERVAATVEQVEPAIQRARKVASLADWSTLTQALTHYLTSRGQYPDMLEELVPEFLQSKQHLQDPWGSDILYEKDAQGSITLSSPGPDRELGTDDDVIRRL